MEDIFSMQSEIAQHVAAEIEASITPEEKQLIERLPTANLTAYDFYQRGVEEFWNWATEGDSTKLDRAESLFYEALYYDSAYALAYVGLAQIYWSKHYYETYFSEDVMDSVLILSNIALSYDDQCSEAYTFKGRYFELTGKSDRALLEYEKAIRFNPNNWMAHYRKGAFYYSIDVVKYIDGLHKAVSLNRGRELPFVLKNLALAYDNVGFKEKSISCLKEALKLDRDSVSYYTFLAQSEFWPGNYLKSIEYYLRAIEIDSTLINSYLARCYYKTGLYKESMEIFESLIERMNEKGEFLSNATHRIAYAFWVNGFEEEADYYFDLQEKYCLGLIKSERPWAHKDYTYYDLAGVYAFRGETEKAYENLRIFNQKKEFHSWMVGLIQHDELFDSIRDEPEFQQIVREVEDKYQAEHERVMHWLEENDML
jgi:tetratricopeptide (TPR) repeat protein